jgi:hypothetical protein
VEFAFTVPIMVLLAFGAYDYGSAYIEGIRLTGAARAGTQQALYDPTVWADTAGARRAALEEYVGHALTDDEIQALAVSATADAFCGCSDGTTLSCSGTCPGGSSAGRFLRVTLNTAVPLILPYPWISNGEFNLAREAVVRAR